MFTSLLIALNIYNVAITSSTCGDYNYAFVIDESGSVGHTEYQQSVDFVIDLITNHTENTAQLAALSFSNTIDWIYRFSQSQLPRKKLQSGDAGGIIDQLNQEKNDYGRGLTGTKPVMEEAIKEFQTNNFTQCNIIILITDGQPNSGGDPCDSTIINDLNTHNIRPIIVAAGGFDPASITCLVGNQTNDIIEISDFDFSSVVTHLVESQVIPVHKCERYNPCTPENITAGAFHHPSCYSCCHFVQCDALGNKNEMPCAAGNYWNADMQSPNMGQCTDPGCSLFIQAHDIPQPTFYTQSSCTDSFDDISLNIGNGATQWHARDDDTMQVSIGFRFTFYGLDYSDILLSSNGFMSFDLTSGSGCCDPRYIPNPYSPNNWILMYQDDMYPRDKDGVSVAYQTKGVAPNREFIYQFTNVAEYFDWGANNFQAVLYETTNIIKLRYGNLNAYDTNGDVPSIGIENIDGSYGILIDASTVSDGDCFEFIPKCPYFGRASPCYDQRYNNPCLDKDALAKSGDYYYPSCTSVCQYIQCDGSGGGTEKVCLPGTVWDDSVGVFGTCVHGPKKIYDRIGEYYLGPSGTWNEADLYCQLNGGYLASIHSQEDLEEVIAICDSYSSSSSTTNCHIGMRYDEQQQLWHWVDGSPTDFGFNIDGTANGQTPPWEASYAYDANNNANCQGMDLNGATGYFDDKKCDKIYPAICYGEPPVANVPGAVNPLGDNNTLNFRSLLDH